MVKLLILLVLRVVFTKLMLLSGKNSSLIRGMLYDK